MSIATLPARTSGSTPKSPTMECVHCSSSMTLTPNPYFGTGLAVHRTIALCNGCDAVAFVPETQKPEPGLVERLLAFARRIMAAAVASE